MPQHHAPPVFVPVGRFVEARAITGLAALGVGALLGSAAQPLGAWGLGLWLGAAGLSDWLTRRQCAPPGQLQWTGRHWLWRPAADPERPVPVQLQVVADGGSVVLLRWRALAPARSTAVFALLRASAMPLPWHGFRCALYCQAAPDPRPLFGQGLGAS